MQSLRVAWAASVLIPVLLGSLAGCAPPERRRSIVLIVVDTLRADHLGLYGYPRRTSPNLDAWSRDGRIYERAHSTSPWTLPTFGSLYTGYLPIIHRAGMAGTTHDVHSPANRISPTAYPLAEQLTGRAVATGAVVNNPFLAPFFGLDRGFEVYDHVAGDNRHMRRADETVTRALAMIDDWAGAPFFLVVHLLDPHMSYDAPPPFRGTFTAAYDSQLTLPVEDLYTLRERQDLLTVADWEFVRAAYDEEVAFTDQELGRLREGLASRGVLEEALVVLTADHGEELLDHGGFEHGHAMWQELLHVPLIVWGPGVTPGREAAPVSLADVAPTILDWLGADARPDLDGISLWPNLATEAPVGDRPIIAEGLFYGDPETAIIRWPTKVVVDADLVPIRVTDLDADPDEVNDRLPHDLSVVAMLVDALRARGDDSSRTATQPPLEEPDPDTLEQLRSLGYVR